MMPTHSRRSDEAPRATNDHHRVLAEEPRHSRILAEDDRHRSGSSGKSVSTSEIVSISVMCSVVFFILVIFLICKFCVGRRTTFRPWSRGNTAGSENTTQPEVQYRSENQTGKGESPYYEEETKQKERKKEKKKQQKNKGKKNKRQQKKKKQQRSAFTYPTIDQIPITDQTSVPDVPPPAYDDVLKESEDGAEVDIQDAKTLFGPEF